MRLIFSYLQRYETTGFSEQFIYFFINKKGDMCTQCTYRYINIDIFSSCFCVLMSEGCKQSISNHMTIVFNVNAINQPFSSIFTINQTVKCFPFSIYLLLYFLYHQTFCKISNILCAFSHASVECFFILYCLFAFQSEVSFHFSPHALCNTFSPREPES